MFKDVRIYDDVLLISVEYFAVFTCDAFNFTTMVTFQAKFVTFKLKVNSTHRLECARLNDKSSSLVHLLLVTINYSFLTKRQQNFKFGTF